VAVGSGATVPSTPTLGLIVAEYEDPKGGGKIGIPTLIIYLCNEMRQTDAPLVGDFLQRSSWSWRLDCTARISCRWSKPQKCLGSAAPPRRFYSPPFAPLRRG